MDNKYAKVSVHKSTHLEFGPNLYPMTALVRGNCVIVNNFKFDTIADRYGSTTDANRLEQVFSQLNFAVIREKNLTAKQILDLFNDISKKDDLFSHNALVVIILTHGHHQVIFGTDYKKEIEKSDSGVVGIRQLIDMFSDKNCLALKGKPKMFFFSCCRGGTFSFNIVLNIILIKF